MVKVRYQERLKAKALWAAPSVLASALLRFAPVWSKRRYGRDVLARSSLGFVRLRKAALACAMWLIIGGSFSVVAAADAPLLPGGKAIAVALESAGASMAVAVEDSGVYVSALSSAAGGGAVSSSAMSWVTQNFAAAPFARALAWDSAGRLWVAASGQGLWRRSASGGWDQVEKHVVQHVALAANGRPMILSNSALLVLAADDKTWERFAPSYPAMQSFVYAPAAPVGSNLFGLTSKDVVVWDGSAWSRTNIALPPRTAQVTSAGELLVGTTNGVYKRATSGAWSTLGPAKMAINAISIEPNGDLAVGTDSRGTMRLQGGSWIPQTSVAIHERRVFALARDGSGNFFAGTQAGITQPFARTTAETGTNAGRGVGGSSPFAARNNGMAGARIRAVKEFSGQAFAVVEGAGVVRLSTDARLAAPQWVDATLGLDADVTHLAANKTTMIALDEDGKIKKWQPSLESWADAGWGAVRDVKTMTIDASDTVWVATQRPGGVYRRSASATSWEAVGAGMKHAMATAITFSDNGTPYAGTDKRGVLQWDEGKKEWTPVGFDGIPPMVSIEGWNLVEIRAIAYAKGKLHIATRYGVFIRSANAPKDTWEIVRSGLKEIDAHTLVVGDQNNVIAGTVSGAFELTPNAKSWIELPELAMEDVRSIALVGNSAVFATKTFAGRSGRVKVRS